MLTPDDIIKSGASGGLWGWAGLGGIAMVASATLLVGMYVWGSLFRNPQIGIYVRQEFYEMFATALIVMLVYGAVAGMGNITVSSLLPGTMMPSGVSPSTTIYAATAKYYETVSDDMTGWLTMNYVVNMYVDQIASVTPYARPLGVGLVASPMAGLGAPIKQLLYNMSVALSVAFVINQAQLLVYIFSLQAFLKYYLPIGLFLRSFTPTRRVGGTLIGVAITFLFIFPALTLISFSMFYHVAGPNDPGGPLLTVRSMMASYLSDTAQGSFTDHFQSFFGNQFGDVGTSLADLIAGAFGGIGSVMEALVGKMFLTLLILPMSAISWAFAIGFVIPVINVLVLTQAAKGISGALGEEVDISALTRMI